MATRDKRASCFRVEIVKKSLMLDEQMYILNRVTEKPVARKSTLLLRCMAIYLLKYFACILL
jgi:hypothetical protein